ncbi:Aste57867_9976 [Aphanomyces stellatus]|uniref:Aste57867_9976 protein n=1 Tax=Aphanomyces stellatus TaxID=120398 RepID=A0A485KP77_9STRA|nr:hypothetical protein As57867_009937 [Aphanomyces stellatus]VFT86854.1 Aste57867_9976 [Aphanomyces stellatus]
MTELTAPLPTYQEQREPAPPTPLRPSWTSFLSIAIMIATGIGFGFAMNKGQVHLPSVIQGQMSFERFTMMKMFVAALGTSVASKAFFRAINPAAFEGIQNQRASDPSHAAVLAAGGLILGGGMMLSGSCPGSVYVQLGAGIPSAIPVFCGALTGTFVFGLLKPLILKWQDGKFKITTSFSISPWSQGGFGFLLLGTASALEVFVPESNYAPSFGSVWLPSVAGVVVGAMQLPLVFLLRRSLGATASYKIIVGAAVESIRRLFGASINWIHVPFLTDLSALVFVVGVIAGSVLAGAPSPASLGVGPSTPVAFVGGGLLGFGATVASGCTSGHGLSGVALLMKSSLIVLPCIFAGAMGMSFLTHHLKAIDLN